MKLDKFVGPFLATALSACAPQHPLTVEGNDQSFDFQAGRHCPTDSKGNPTTGIEKRGVWSVECADENGNGLIDLIRENRGSLNSVCHTLEGTEDNC